MKKLVIGILAHVDSGKTTLSEAVLYSAGEIRRLGRVDHRDAFLDTNKIERERGITIFSKQARFCMGESEFTLLDTPGHVDFSAETERTLQVLDYAVLVISGTDGVQSHTHTLWQLLKRYDVPVFIFVNKMDLPGAEKASLIGELKKELDSGCVDFSDDDCDSFFEDIAVCDEALMQSLFDNGSIESESIAEAVCERKVFPCFFGSALKNNGVEEFLSGLDKYTIQKEYTQEFGAKVYKISEDESGKRLTHMKITGGTLSVKAVIPSLSEKVNEIRLYSGEKYKGVQEAVSGEICAVTGLTKTFAGQGIGIQEDSLTPALEPVFTYKVLLPRGTDVHTGLTVLRRLEQEETQLHVLWDERLQEINVQLMGEVQLEVLRDIIAERFGIEVEFGQGSIIYKETISDTVEGVGHYEPLRHYSEVHLLLEPLPRGAGLVFDTDCSEDVLDRNWQRLIMTHLLEKTYTGVLTNSPITDIKITLIAGRAHLKHTEGGDFRQSTYRAVRQGLKQAKNILLEPWYDFTLSVPQGNIGRAMTDIQTVGGSIGEPMPASGGLTAISGSAPVSKMRGYHREITAYTHGLGRLTCVFGGYRECTDAETVIEKIGYNSDEDMENTADSVFCSHGAGFVVKWDKVFDYMHIEARREKKEPEPQISTPRQYAKRIADDAELLSIFERTYGKIQRKAPEQLYTSVKPSKPSQPKYPKAKPDLRTGDYLLVDGYNIIFAWEDLKTVAAESLESARKLLVDRLANYQIMKHTELIVVFDAYKVRGGCGSVEKHGNITVVYTKEAETADAYIERVTHEIGKKHKVRVATSDSLEQMIILGNGALRISANEFLKEIEVVETELEAFIKSHNVKTNNVE